MKILVTGGAGYVGSVLIPVLLEKGHQVTILDLFLFDYTPILHFAHHPKLTVVNADIRNQGVVKQHLKGKDLIIHLAAIVGFPACARDESAAISTNIESTRTIVENMDKGQSLFFASSGSSYGRVDGICTEDTPINPLTLYGRSKAESEKIIFDSKHASNAIAFRFATVFGVSPRLRLDLLVNDFVYKAINDKIIVLYEGHFRRTFLHVNDAALSYIHLLDNFDSSKGQIFNVGADEMNYTKAEVAELIGKKVPYEIYRSDIGTDLDQRDYEVSYVKITDSGFKCTMSLEQGLDELIKVISFIKVKQQYRNA